VRLTRRLHVVRRYPGLVRSTSPVVRRCCATCCDRPSRSSGSSALPGAWYASCSSARTLTARSRSRWTPLSLLCRLATSVPPPRFHTVKYAGVLAPVSPPWRSRIAPQRTPPPRAAETHDADPLPKHAGTVIGFAATTNSTEIPPHARQRRSARLGRVRLQGRPLCARLRVP
jgi:hypothetical protein